MSMRKAHPLLILALLFLLGPGCIPGGSKPPPPGAPARSPDRALSFSIIYTGSLGGNVLPSPYNDATKSFPSFSFTQIREIARRLGAGGKDTVFLLDGGGFQGEAGGFSRHFGGKPMIALMKAAGYHAVLADGEGLSPDLIRQNDFLLSPATGIRPFRKLKAGTKTVTVFAFFEAPGSGAKPLPSLKDAVAKEGGDFNVLLCCTGRLRELARNAGGIDLIIPGRCDGTLPPRESSVLEGITVAPWVDSRYSLGRVEVKDGKITARVVSGAGADPMPPPEYAGILAPYVSQFQKTYGDNYSLILSWTVAYAAGEIGSPRDFRESPLASLACDTIRRRTGADVAVINHYAARGSLSGVIPSSKILQVFPFENEIVTMEIKGKDLQEILSANARRGDAFYQVSGIVLGIDPEGGRAEILKDGKPLEPERHYRVATIDYLAAPDKKKYELFKKGERARHTGLILNNVLTDGMLEYPLLLKPGRRMLTSPGLTGEALQSFYRENSPDALLASAGAPGLTRKERQARLFRAAEILISLRLTGEAAGILEELQKSGFSAPSMALYLAAARYGQGRFGEAADLLNPSGRKDPAAAFLRGMSLYRAGKGEKAAAIFDDLARAHPGEAAFLKIAQSLPSPSKEKPLLGADPQWRTFKGDFARTGGCSRGPGQGKVLWKFKTFRPVQSSPAIGHDGTVYCASGDGCLYAVRPSGAQKWKVRLGKSLLASPTIAGDGSVLAGSDDGRLYCVSPAGVVRWSFATGGWVISSPAVGREGSIYFGSNDKSLYCLDSTGALAWKRSLGGEVFSSPALDREENVLVGCLDGRLYKVSRRGDVLWSFKTGGKVYSTPAVYRERILFGSDDGFVYCLDSRGGLRWKFKTGGFVPSSPSLDARGNIYVGSEDGRLYCLDFKGSKLWDFKTDYEIFGSPVIDGEGRAYFGSDDTFIYALSPGGRLLWRVKTDKYVESTPAVSRDGRLYVGSDDGHVYCIE
jgi:outer membrane protein assembly factor BamB/2',3'-cyclic-nucleotide 2'-phosphodiesterase (5'-nucleotidase family)